MYYNKDYRLNVLARFSFHNAGVHGNKTTIQEVYDILGNQIMPETHMGIRQFYEIDNHRLAYDYILNRYENDQTMSLQMIRDIHGLLLDRLDPSNGLFKSTRMAITETDYMPVSVSGTKDAVKEWVQETNQAVLTTEDPQAFMKVLAEAHLKFEQIHPFLDGNGRVGRLILMYLSMKYLKVPTYFYKEDYDTYLKALGDEDVETLQGLLYDTYVNEKRIQEMLQLQ